MYARRSPAAHNRTRIPTHRQLAIGCDDDAPAARPLPSTPFTHTYTKTQTTRTHTHTTCASAPKYTHTHTHRRSARYDKLMAGGTLLFDMTADPERAFILA